MKFLYLQFLMLFALATILLPGCKPKTSIAVPIWDNMRTEWNDNYKRVRIEWDCMDKANRSYADSEDAFLKNLGDAGWELVNTQRDEENHCDVLFFKRPWRKDSQHPIVFQVK